MQQSNYDLQLNTILHDSSICRDLTTVYTNKNWFVILLSHVYFGDWVTKIRHLSLLKTNNSAQLRAVTYLKFISPKASDFFSSEKNWGRRNDNLGPFINDVTRPVLEVITLCNDLLIINTMGKRKLSIWIKKHSNCGLFIVQYSGIDMNNKHLVC